MAESPGAMSDMAQKKGFMYKGVLINGPLLHPEDKVPVLDLEALKKDPANPRLVMIDGGPNGDFNPRIHKKITMEEYNRMIGANIAPVEPVPAESPSVSSPAPVSDNQEAKDRFISLSLRGYVNLSKDEKKEFGRLKDILAGNQNVG